MDRCFVAQLNNYRITTAEILYWMPDHKHLLQSFVWQNLDMAPRFPNLTKFLDFWERNLRFKTDSSDKGPPAGKPVIMSAGMMGDRASVIFAAPEEMSRSITNACS